MDALWRFQIPEELRKKYGYPELTDDAKRKILGLNSAKLNGIKEVRARDLAKYKPVPKDYERRMSKELKTIMEFPGFTADNMSKVREKYAASGAERSNARYGWIRVS